MVVIHPEKSSCPALAVYFVSGLYGDKGVLVMFIDSLQYIRILIYRKGYHYHLFSLAGITSRDFYDSRSAVYLLDYLFVDLLVFFRYYLRDKGSVASDKYLVHHHCRDKRRDDSKKRDDEIPDNEHTADNDSSVDDKKRDRAFYSLECFAQRQRYDVNSSRGASAGVSKKEYGDKSLSEELESIVEARSFYSYREGENKLSPLRDGGSHYVSCAMPIISEGDIVGCVAALSPMDTDKTPEAVEQKLVQTAASFLGRQMES